MLKKGKKGRVGEGQKGEDKGKVKERQGEILKKGERKGGRLKRGRKGE